MGGNILKRFSSFGVASSGGTDLLLGNYFFTRDILGSVREMCDQTGNVRGQFEYSPYGLRQRLGGDLEPGFGFTGHPLHLPSSLHLAPFRAYDARLGRWISRDPLGEAEGANLYAYLLSDPVNFLDPLGEGGTRADTLVQNTAGYKDAKAGISALDTAKTIVKTVDKIGDKGVKATVQGKFEDMGKDAIEKIAPSPIKQYEDGVTQMANTAQESGNLYDKAKKQTYGKAFDALRGAPCAPTQAPPVKVDPPTPGFFDNWFTSSPSTSPAQRDGPIPRKSTFSEADRAAAAASH